MNMYDNLRNLVSLLILRIHGLVKGNGGIQSAEKSTSMNLNYINIINPRLYFMVSLMSSSVCIDIKCLLGTVQL